MKHSLINQQGGTSEEITPSFSNHIMPESKFILRRQKMEARLLKYIEVKGQDECWNWTGSTLCARKYPQRRIPKCCGYDPLNAQKVRATYPYRLMYMLRVGPIPPGMTVDHLCFNPLCCNPNHLQILSMAQNAARKNPLNHINRIPRSHCQNGHLLTGDNFLNSSKGRKCRTCRNDYMRAFMRDKAKSQANNQRREVSL